MDSIFILVDCNNFYVSCERIFNPAIINKPVVVLSNNDGCIIARSEEAKALNIPMGAPFYQYKHIIQKHQVMVYSSNYQLYGDISQRIMTLLESYTSNLEVYSIDEAFLKFQDLDYKSLAPLSKEIHKIIQKYTGIPTSFGIGPSKTLAKAANYAAKRLYQTPVFDMQNPRTQVQILSRLPVEKIWGISTGWGKKLHALGIHTALNLRESSPTILRNKFGIVMERIIYELQGISCLDLETDTPKKSIMSSKSFGIPLYALTEIEEALSHYAVRSCEKLRKQASKAYGILVFLKTNPFKERQNYYKKAQLIRFETPSSNTSFIIQQAKRILKKIFIKGYAYHKCGIQLLDLVPDSYEQTSLFTPSDSSKNKKLMQTIDEINTKIGANTILFGSQGIREQWVRAPLNRSPRYTTQWAELLAVR